MASARELTAEEVDLKVDGQPNFRSTEELEALDRIVGQPRAMRALDLGLGTRHASYNIFVAGMNGTGKKEMIRHALANRVRDEPAPPDWIYVNNFDQPDEPIAADLTPGQGLRFQKDMAALVAQLQDELPKSFRQEDFSREKQRLKKEYERRNEEVFDQLKKRAADIGLMLQQTADGQAFLTPMKDGRSMTLEEVERLSEEEREEIGKRQNEITDEATSLFSRGRELTMQLSKDVRDVEKNFASRVISPLVDELASKYPHYKLTPWFEKLKSHMIENLDRFRQRDEAQPPWMSAMGIQQPQGGAQFGEYSVNVLVDNSRSERAPVIVEESPNYKNLFGTIGGMVDRFGRVVSDFSRVRAGSLLRANGGYLVLNIMDALIEPLVWKELKRAIKSGHMEFHAYDPLGIFTATAIRPEPIPLKVKLVVLGNPLIYHLLYLYDEDFHEVFKVKADFTDEMERDGDSLNVVGRFLQKLRQKEALLPFSADAVREFLRIGARMAGDRDKMTTEFSRLGDVARESSYWARSESAPLVDSSHVRRALDEKVYRSDLIAGRIRELIQTGVLLISREGAAIGQANGLAVANLGDYMFGRPARVTVSVGLGATGVINIERESKLSGSTYDKALLILEGYLRNKYAGARPLTVSASIAMEQSYGIIEGDSATITELVCLLSAIAQVPLRQDIAMTGSVNQWGQVQAIGAVNEKIEGFFDVCRQGGLTGRQGVCIPASNVRNLILRPDVVEAIREGSFHVWAVEDVDQALELMSGMPAGDISTEGTLHGKVSLRLGEMAEALKKQQVMPGGYPSFAPPEPPGQRDPRPPLPGSDSERDRDPRIQE